MMYLERRADPIPLPPKPYVLSPSGSFDGNDGKWTTFLINIGDDGTGQGQTVKVLISTSSPLTLVPQQAGWCNQDCAKRRGMLIFHGKQPLGLELSQQWKTAGIYNIPLPNWWSNNLTANSTSTLSGVWGSENLGMGESSAQSPVIQEQYVVKYTFQDFFLGSLGLAVGEVGPQGGTKPNFLDNFYKAANQIASASYGYTAGAYYRNNGRGVMGNLVLGGYDKSRFTAQGPTIYMPNEKNNSLVVGVQSILYAPDQDVETATYSISRPEEGFEANIDSTIPYLILPDRICNEFQQKFQLQFDEDIKLYTVNKSAHEWNTQQNATVSFKIGAGRQDSNKFTTIVLPYAAFDQQVSFPITAEATQYFPIKKSDNGIYVLGRTFLQEAYIVVDYERANFTVAPAYFSEPMPDESLVPIFNKTYTGIMPQKDADSGLSTGAIAGIVVGIVLAFIIAGVGAFLWWKKRRHTKMNALPHNKNPSEVDTASAGDEVKYPRVLELTGSELPKPSTTEYYGNDHKLIPPISEMSPESPPAELYSPPQESASERTSPDYFAAGKPRRRGATRDSSGQNTPGTQIAELPGDGTFQPVHSRGPSDTSLSPKIDQVLARQPVVQPGEAATADEIHRARAGPNLEDTVQEHDPRLERRPSHARNLSDTTVQSDSTAVSQPTPDELERWARSVDDGPRRPMSP
ncbi:acid protease [Cucurbitaria berberidis CBS 394.84]|uniref:Acid protease n=1 Tax=Cucurbitaria berberidis CBS 394.84 TaxID=1168544 RepID=A0A9P4GKS1_9PLEO|nr:acid protease [Cucurbitaria berberidis CBS 394.84]KAF1847047.1 acid protease [Cucurbitaria berberidis CBS 394.84]